MQDPPTDPIYYIFILELCFSLLYLLPFCRDACPDLSIVTWIYSMWKQDWKAQQGAAFPVFYLPPGPRCDHPGWSLSSALLGPANMGGTTAPLGSPPHKRLNMSFPHNGWAPLAHSLWTLNGLSDSINSAELHKPFIPPPHPMEA